MKFRFLGGAESIGASCTAIEIDDRRWVVDCGIRMKGTGSERLPDLARLEETGPPSAVLVTHAHLDHIGALPVLASRYPFAPVYATPPTIALTRVQLFDSLKIMAEDSGAEGELPLYTEAAATALLERMIPVQPLRAFRPDADGPEVTFFPAGHIIGACSIGIQGREGSAFLSGDVSVDNQRTVPGMRAPRFRADVAVFESTYGRKLHPDRALEEERLVRLVAETLASGGKVLVPAFAIGRAQEVILILLKALLAGTLPSAPIHVDGMVRACCAVYSSFPKYLQSTLERRISKYGDPFFGVLDSVKPVRSREERAAIVAGPPCVIVSSSGMLSGGPSPWYAAQLAADERNLIAITGYQDEESPGRALLDRASGKVTGKPTEKATGKSTASTADGFVAGLKCRVASHALSGHASGAQIAALIQALEPADVLLVHGDASARRDLADLLLREKAGRIHLPVHGDAAEPVGRRRREGSHPKAPEFSGGSSSRGSTASRLRATGIGGATRREPISSEALETLARHVRETYREGASFTVEELLQIWRGERGTEEDASILDGLLRASPCFRPHPVRLFEFQAVVGRSAGGGPGSDGASAGSTLPLDPASLLARLDAAMPPEARLLRKSYQPGIPHLVLAFDFPDIAAAKHAATIEDALRGTGWTWAVYPMPNSTALEHEIRSLAPDPRLVSRVSIHTELRCATVHLSRTLFEEEAPSWAAAAEALKASTGFALECVAAAGTPAPKEARDAEGRLEINLAFQAIRGAFGGEAHAPYRIGKKPGPGGISFIELAFISPEVGERYRATLDRLGAEIGWRLTVAATANQSAIVEEARRLLSSARIRRGPSFAPATRSVRVALAESLDSVAWEDLARQFRERTGYRLEREA